MTYKPVLLVVASEGYQQIEYSQTKKALEAAGLFIKVASNNTIPAIAKDGSTVAVDLLLSAVDTKQYSGVLFIGGPGTMENLDNEVSYRIIKQADTNQIPIGAICMATRILANAGILTDRRATGFDGDGMLSSIFKNYDIEYVHSPVVVDGLIITATGPEAATQFGTQAAQLIKKIHPSIVS